MTGFVRWIKGLYRELRRRQVIRVAVVYATTGFVILQLAEILVDPFGLGPWALRLITLVLILGFPLAVGLAWVYNLTDEGVVEIEEETTQENVSGQSTVTSNGLIVGLLAIAIGLLLYPRFFSSGEQATGSASSTEAGTAQIDERSIAVLPFDPLSPDQRSKTFARGVHDDLLARLSNISDLTVISRTSVERYRDTSLPLPAIADSLGVRWVMEGGVQKAGEQIQVRAQLIDPRTDGHVWANDYQRRLTAQNLFAIQGEITQKIADALEAQLTAGEQDRIAGAPTEDLEAYRLYVRGRNLLASRRPDSIKRAQRHFEQALARDSTYALAWAGLADAHILYDLFGPQTSQAQTKSALEKAYAAATRSRDLDPSLAEAWSAIGAVHMQEYARGLDRGDGPAALKALLRAVELKPSYAQAQQWLGELYYRLGRPGRGLEHASLAVELNPEHVGARRVLIVTLLANGRAPEAWRHVQRLPPALREGFDAIVLYDLERWDKLERIARKDLHRNLELARLTSRVVLARIAALRGDTSRARTHLAEVARQDGASAHFSEGVIHAALGETDSAFSAWQRIDEWAGPTPGTALRYGYPDILTPLRDDPRYQKLIRDLNVSWGLNPDGSLPADIDVPTSLTDR